MQGDAEGPRAAPRVSSIKAVARLTCEALRSSATSVTAAPWREGVLALLEAAGAGEAGRRPLSSSGGAELVPWCAAPSSPPQPPSG